MTNILFVKELRMEIDVNYCHSVVDNLKRLSNFFLHFVSILSKVLNLESNS
jgi:hypothetical protein